MTIFGHDVSFKKLMALITLLFLVVAIPVGMYLVKQQQILKSRASLTASGAVFVDSTGNPITTTNTRNVKLKVLYVPPVSSPSPSPSPSPSASVQTATASATPSPATTSAVQGISTDGGGIFGFIGRFFERFEARLKLTLIKPVEAAPDSFCYSDTYCDPGEYCENAGTTYGRCRETAATSTQQQCTPLGDSCTVSVHGANPCCGGVSCVDGICGGSASVSGTSSIICVSDDNCAEGYVCSKSGSDPSVTDLGYCIRAPVQGLTPAQAGYDTHSIGAYVWDKDREQNLAGCSPFAPCRGPSGSLITYDEWMALARPPVSGVSVNVFGPCGLTAGQYPGIPGIGVQGSVACPKTVQEARNASCTSAITNCVKRTETTSSDGKVRFTNLAYGGYVIWVDPLPDGKRIDTASSQGRNPWYLILNDQLTYGSQGWFPLTAGTSSSALSCPAQTGTPLGGNYPTHFKVANTRAELAFADEIPFWQKLLEPKEVQAQLSCPQGMHVGSSGQCEFNCATEGQTWSAQTPCCSGLSIINVQGQQPTCGIPCRGANQACGGAAGSCCSGLECFNPINAPQGVCRTPPPPPPPPPATDFNPPPPATTQTVTPPPPPTGGTTPPPPPPATSVSSVCEMVYDNPAGRIIDWTLPGGAGQKTVWVQFKVGGVWGSPIESQPVTLATGAQASSSPSAAAQTTATGSNNSKYDLNKDGVVNTVDVSLFLVEFQKGPGRSAATADFNSDGVINTADYSLLLKNFGPVTTSTQSQSTTPPPPTGGTTPPPPPPVVSTTPTPSPSPALTSTGPAKKVFVTSTTYTGNLGGLNGADSKCQTRAQAANLTGTFKAWLSTTSVSAASRLSHSNGPYKLVNGTTVANNWTDLTDGTLQAPIDIQENGTKVSYTNPANAFVVWTGTSASGQFLGGSSASGPYDDCGGWTVGQVLGSHISAAKVGSVGYTNNQWTESPGGGGASCFLEERLYCFEQ